jgi:glycosyltransferase involved in cell wall biosynthesis
MAMGKCVIVSDVKALEEFIENGKNGLIHQKDNPMDLRRCIEELVSDDGLREKVGLGAREWVIKNRTWDIAGGVIESAYSKLLL